MNKQTGICLLILLLPTCLFFGPILIQDQTFAYRDSARFYYRQFEWNQAQWRKGEIPLWNSQENLGTPVVAEASSSVFYPLQVLFLIPGIKFSKAFVLYAAIHVYLASVGAFFLARCLGCRHLNALLGGISYALSGSLIFQACNIVFLVGGCWLPFGVWMSLRLVQKPGFNRAVGLASFLALAVLGGDPQTAYHIGLVSAIFLVYVWRNPGLVNSISDRRDRSGVSTDRHSNIGSVAGWHLAAAAIAMGLAAVQVLPSWNATKQSTRSYYENPRTVWELSASKQGNALQGIFGHPVASTHHDHLYQFSQSPWTCLELIWPNVTGKVESTHSRWAESIPAASRTWTPSLYCGLLPIVFFLSSCLRRSSSWKESWAKICFLIFAIGSLGWFGLGWLIHETSFWIWGTDPATSSIGAPVGGVYWFFVVLLPGYVNFRYPAKLFVVATLFLCIMAARESQLALRKHRIKRIRNITIALLLLTTGILVGLWLSSIPVQQWLNAIQFRSANEFGPLDIKSVWSSVLWALLHTFAVGMVVLNLIGQGWRRRTITGLLLLLTLIDLSIANRQLLLTARASLWERPNEIATTLRRSSEETVRVYRTDPMTWSTKNRWLQTAAENRLEQIVDFEVQTLMPKHHLAGQSASEKNIGVLESFRTIEDIRFGTLMSYLKSRPAITTGDSFDVPLAPDPNSLGVLSCDYLLIPQWGRPNVSPQSSVMSWPSHEAILFPNSFRKERFRIATRFEKIEPINDLASWFSDRENRVWLNKNSSLANPSGGVAVVECGPDVALPDPSDDPQQDPDRRQVVTLAETQTRIRLKLERAEGLLIVADAYDDDWKAYSVTATGQKIELPVLRTHFVLRGIPVTKEIQEVVLEYHPKWVFRGFYVGILTLMTLLTLGVFRVVRANRKQ